MKKIKIHNYDRVLFWRINPPARDISVNGTNSYIIHEEYDELLHINDDLYMTRHKTIDGNTNEMYCKLIDGKLFLHRDDNLPAKVDGDGVLYFFENGYNKRLEDLYVSDEEKVIMILKYGEIIDNSNYYTYSYRIK